MALVAGMALAVAACGGGSDVSETDDATFGGGGATETDAPATGPDTSGDQGVSPAATGPDATTTDTGPSSTSDDAVAGDADAILNVPGEYATIQAAVDMSRPGDLVLIEPGEYNEAINVVTDELVIRGLEREGVVLDGDFELDNGIRVLGAQGVAVENLTVQNYTDNGVFFTSATGYRASYVTAYRNGDYGIYAFDSVDGQIENSYGAGSPDAGFYIGQCFPCNANIDNVLSEHNGLGYSGTNAGGDLYIVNSEFRKNRAGVVPNSGSYELCYPQRAMTIVGNTVTSNNQPDTPAIDVAILAMGNGILPAGGIANVIERNYVNDHDRTGIALVPFLEEGANDDIPAEDEWDLTCEETRAAPPADFIPETILWDPYENIVRDNVISNSREADIGVAGVDALTGALRNCWIDNSFETSRPANLETIAPCDGEALDARDPAWQVDTLNVLSWLAEAEDQPPAVDYEIAELPPVPDLDDMPDAATAPPAPATDVPFALDIDSIETPEP